MVDPYFEDSPAMQRRQVLLWAVTARRQLDRWEPLVARNLWAKYPRGEPAPVGLRWQGEAEQHFALVALDHLLEALKLWPTPVSLPAILTQEVAEVRDLVTHWKDNMPVFNVQPRRQVPPRNTGKRFAERNPRITPYDPMAWNAARGALLTRNVSASDARTAIKAAQTAVLAEDSALARFVPPEEPSPWFVDEQGNWWPLQARDL